GLGPPGRWSRTVSRGQPNRCRSHRERFRHMDFPQEFGSASHRLRSWRDAAAGPYPDAATAAEDVVRLLSRLAPSTDLWLVTATEGRRFSGRQSLLARLRPPTSSLCGDQEAFIRLMLTGSGTASPRALMPADHPDLGRPAVSYV